jgi:hypothetical protein
MPNVVTHLSEPLGHLTGIGLSPLVRLGSVLREGRLLHPRGLVLEGYAEPLATGEAEKRVAERLAGPVLARFSGAFWKHREWLDVLGCALRFRGRLGAVTAREPDDQDLLFATVRHPATTLLAPISTRFRDALDNTYFGVSPFWVQGLERRVWLRLVPLTPSGLGDDREARLLARLLEGPVLLNLEMYGRDKRATPLVRIALTHAVLTDPRSLYFDPFHAGRGIHPRGFVQYMRKATCAAGRRLRLSQAAAAAEPEPQPLSEIRA